MQKLPFFYIYALLACCANGCLARLPANPPNMGPFAGAPQGAAGPDWFAWPLVFLAGLAVGVALAMLARWWLVGRKGPALLKKRDLTALKMLVNSLEDLVARSRGRAVVVRLSDWLKNRRPK